jgi:hypothetical protein
MSCGIVTQTAGTNQHCDAASELGRSTLIDTRWSNLNNLTSNRAVGSFVAEAQGVAQAGLGETLGEWRQSLDMIVSRLNQLTAAAKALRQRNPQGFFRALGIPNDKAGRARVRDRIKPFGEKWLEFHLGWVPLCQDIYNGLQAFSREPFPQRCQGRARSSDSYVSSQSFTLARNTSKVNYHVGVRVQGDIRIVNPNVALAASLGLANPVSVAWALVPYSFVIDWFVNVSDALGLYDGLLGCGTERTFYTMLRLGDGVYRSEVRVSTTLPWKVDTYKVSLGVSVLRTIGLPPSHLTYPNSPRFSWQRGLTAVALLLQFL